jgi:hypothetical protein
MDLTNTKRNDPCPCGSGKKFKNCHMSHPDDLLTDQMQLSPGEVALRISKLPQAEHEWAKELVKDMVFTSKAGRKVRIKLVDLDAYRQLTLFGQGADNLGPGGLMINPFKTRVLDPDHIYIALTPDCNKSTIIHELAHVADLIEGSGMQPERGQAVSKETGIPAEFLEHPQEFAERLLDFSSDYGVQLDAEDEIVAYLARRNLLLPGKTIARAKPDEMTGPVEKAMRELKENQDEINKLIKNRKGYLGKGK